MWPTAEARHKQMGGPQPEQRLMQAHQVLACSVRAETPMQQGTPTAKHIAPSTLQTVRQGRS